MTQKPSCSKVSNSVKSVNPAKICHQIPPQNLPSSSTVPSLNPPAKNHIIATTSPSKLNHSSRCHIFRGKHNFPIPSCWQLSGLWRLSLGRGDTKPMETLCCAILSLRPPGASEGVSEGVLKSRVCIIMAPACRRLIRSVSVVEFG